MDWQRRSPIQHTPNRSRLRLVHCVRTGVLALLAALASSTAASADDPQARAWQTFVDAEAGFAIEVPAGHDVARSDAGWYIHGWHEGEPTVPDAAIYFEPGADAQAVIAERFSQDADVERLPFGRGTEGIRVTDEYHNQFGDPYRQSTYLVQDEDGVYVLTGWEDLYWEPYDEVAMSFRFVELIEDRSDAPR